MKLPVILTPGEDGWIIAECPVLPGCVSQGKTKEDALENIKEAAELWLEDESDGFEIQMEYAEIEVAI
ncbi:MAG: type II toxin-antitoxin system HicB family antitoxin [Bacillota bacterium]|nr:type II toxin-antitoxin system HicB family antitoxin [Bacillota bacterium]